MKINSKEIAYCTYFDKNYLIKGLAMCTSLLKYSPDTTLFVLCMDDYTEKILKAYKLKNLKVIKLKDFEDKELLAIKDGRTFYEYYWTCTPSLPLFIFNHFKKYKYVTYVDADLFFYSSPEVAIAELGEKSILTVEHRYPKGQEGRMATTGRFNVAFQIFKRDKVGLSCLERWRKQCIDWCYYRLEDGKMGDQLYLNEWPQLYKNDIVMTKNLGIDTAPWNVKQYRLSKPNNNVLIENDILVCYHFHQFQIISDNTFENSTGYFLSQQLINLVYIPYRDSLKEQIKKVKLIDRNFEITAPERSFYLRIRSLIIKFIGPLYWAFFTKLAGQKNERKIGINILFLIPNQVGGTEYHLRSFISYLQKMDQKNKYVIFCNKENYETINLENHNWEKVLCNIEAKDRVLRILYEQIWLPFLIWRNKCRTIHSYGYFGPIFCPAKSVITVHDANWKDHPEDTARFTRITLKILIEWNLKVVSKVIVDSDFSKNRLQHHFPDLKNKIFVIKAGIDEQFKLLAKRKLKHPFRNKPFILCVSAFYPHKKIPYLFSVWDKVSQVDKNLCLVLIGHNGLDEKEIVEKAERSERVYRFHKVSFSELVAFYKFANCFVLPSIYEGFGFPVYEALFLGTPTIVGDKKIYDKSVQDSLTNLSWDVKKDAGEILKKKKKLKPVNSLNYEDGTKKLIELYESI